MQKRHIYFVVSHPIQYFVPLYRQLAAMPGVEVTVIFLTDETIKGNEDRQFGVSFVWDIPLLEGYRYEFLENRSWKPSMYHGFWGLFHPQLFRRLRGLPKGLVIVNGWQYASYVMAYLAAKISGHTVAIRCEAPVYKELNRSGLKNKVRSWLLGKFLFKYIIRRFLYLGVQNRAFYSYYGVQDDALFFSPYSIDNDRFTQGIKQRDRVAERDQLLIAQDDFVILFTGKFIDVKRPLDLLKAFEKMTLSNSHLVLVGDGTLKESMKSYVQEHAINNVHFVGFVNQTELPRYYALSDVLVLCSESETWGLSVNEAMASGLPVVVSDGVGCAEDLVREGQNGYKFPKGDYMALKDALEEVALRKKEGSPMGEQSLAIIHEYSLQKSAEGIVAAAM